MNLNASEWKEFLLTKICDVDYGNKFDNDKMTYYNPSINFVSRTGDNNGVKDVVDRIEGVKPYKAGCISVALGGSIGACYLQTSPFYTGQNVAVLTFDDNISENTKLFFTQVFMFEVQKKFVAFGRELNKHIKTDFSVFLPIQYNPDGSPLIDNTFKYSDKGYVPDWQFMEDYIKSLHFKPLTTKRVNEKKIELNVSQWEDFYLGDLFDEMYKGKAYTDEDLEGIVSERVVPYITRTDMDNGCKYMANVTSDFNIEKGNAISIGDTTATCFYQKNDFITGDHMVVLRASWLNQLRGLFFIGLFGLEKLKYSYGRAYKMDNIKKTIFKLPIQRNTDGSPVIDKEKKYHNKGYIPDWQFMENYINSLPYSDRII